MKWRLYSGLSLKPVPDTMFQLGTTGKTALSSRAANSSDFMMSTQLIEIEKVIMNPEDSAVVNEVTAMSNAMFVIAPIGTRPYRLGCSMTSPVGWWPSRSLPVFRVGFSSASVRVAVQVEAEFV